MNLHYYTVIGFVVFCFSGAKFGKCEQNELEEDCDTKIASCVTSGEHKSDKIVELTNVTDINAKRKSMNFTAPFRKEFQNEVGSVPSAYLPKEHRLDDVSIEENDEDFDNYTSPNFPANEIFSNASTVKTIFTECVEKGKTYRIGEKFDRGCEETCQCSKNGEIICAPRCRPPFFSKGYSKKDPLCAEEEIDTDPCCVMLKCEDSDSVPESQHGCIYRNVSYKIGVTFKDGCESICTCEDHGKISCKPRCAPIKNLGKNCITVPDSKDPCCTVALCDVEEPDLNKVPISGLDDGSLLSSMFDNQIISAVPMNSTSVRLLFAEKSDECEVQVSSNGIEWVNKSCPDDTVRGLQPGRTYYFRLKNNLATNTVRVVLPSETRSATGTTCEYKGKTYNRGDEFHDGCEAFCICDKTGVECAPIECPTDFGLDVLDPQCLDWEMHPPGFVPSPPNCCPDKVHCKNNGSCTYKGQNFPNWSEIPTKLSGCEKRCYCEMGNVTCQQICPPVPAKAPPNLPCPQDQAILTHLPGDDCCLFWICPNNAHHGFGEHGLIPNFPSLHGQANSDIKIHVLEPVDDTTVKLVFSVPAYLVGLHGRVELRYTSDKSNNEVSTWDQQILAPPNDLIATQELEFELGALQPNTTYKIKISLNMHDIANTPTSDTLTVTTPVKMLPSSTLPPIIPIEPDLRVIEVNSTWVKLVWRTFNEFELQFIDGIQLRYKEMEDKVYSATPLIHRAVTYYTVENLKPDSSYEFGIFFIPFTGQSTELQAQKGIQIRTTPENDPYKFNLILEVHHVKSSSVEITWSGVPYPEDKYVNIFRAIYQSDGNREDFSSFKVAKRDSPQTILISDLKPNARYRLWLEAYLTSGRIKKSNVKDFVTKAGPSLPAVKQGKLEGSPLIECNSYYGPMIGVSILAVLAVLAALILLLILAKKHATNKAPITNPIHQRKITTGNTTSAAYDNPSYKTCDNDKMENGVKSNTIPLAVFNASSHNGKDA